MKPGQIIHESYTTRTHLANHGLSKGRRDGAQLSPRSAFVVLLILESGFVDSSDGYLDFEQ